MRVQTQLLLLLLALLAVACAYPGFPIQEGDINRGKQAFVDHQCHQCHSVSETQLPPLAGSDVVLELGGEIINARTYTDLMTSIINPSHVQSEKYRQESALSARANVNSPMPMPDIDRMTVRQLIDIVTFLDSKYILIEEYSSAPSM